MPARKGIKAKIVAWLYANPGVELNTREIERMYVEHGGAVNGDKYPERLRGRVSRDTMHRLVEGLPVELVREGRTWYHNVWRSKTTP